MLCLFLLYTILIDLGSELHRFPSRLDKVEQRTICGKYAGNTFLMIAQLQYYEDTKVIT